MPAEHEEVIERGGRRVTVWRSHYRRNEALDTAVHGARDRGDGAASLAAPAEARARMRLVLGVIVAFVAWAISTNLWLTAIVVYALLLYAQRRLDPHE